MSYLFLKEAFEHFNLGIVKRVLTETSLSSSVILSCNYLYHEYQLARQNQKGEVLPTAMHLELTTYCKNRCPGCYIPLTDRKNPEITDVQTMITAIQLGNSSGIRIYNLVGGEPLSERTIPIVETILDKFPLLSMYVCTNGEYIASHSDKLESILSKPNISIGLSVNSFRQNNDETRFNGSYDVFTKATKELKDRKVLYCGVVTLLPQTWKDATSSEFIDFLIERGCLYVFYSIPRDLNERELNEALNRISHLKNKPIFMYTDNYGHIGSDSPLKRERIIYVDKKGIILNDRRERIPVGNINGSLEEVVKSELWTKRFTNHWSKNMGEQ